MTEAMTKASLKAEAAAWVAKLQDSGGDPEIRAAAAAWRAEHPDHDEAFAVIDALWGELGDLKSYRDDAALAELDEPLLREHLAAVIHRSFGALHGMLTKPLAPIGASLAAASLLVFFLWPGSEAPVAPIPDYQTKIAEVRDIPLGDGSVVTLGAASAVDVAFSPEERRVTLATGEAFFSVVRDEYRPFIVVASDTVVHVVGTKFDVRHSTDEVRVSVLEGVVEVRQRADESGAGGGSPAEPQVLTAGRQAVAEIGVRAPIAISEDASPGAWRSGRLAYDGAPLSEVIFDANRYYDGEIVLASKEIADLAVTTSFRAEQVEQMIRTLDGVLPIEVDYRADGEIVLRQAEDN